MKKILVTAALPYVNNYPHLGNLVPTLSADCYSRYLKLKGVESIFVCGTDEHGTTTETKALEEGLTPKQITDKYFKIHSEIYKWFLCNFDCFGRTSSKENKERTLDIFSKLEKNDYIVENEIEQFFCEQCDKFLADRFIEGECPFCSYTEARGDQCESCGKLFNATELKNPKCKVCSSLPIVKKTKHLFIDLPKIEPSLKKWIDSVKVNWSDNARTMTDAWMKEGLRQRCITRDLKWGISVPGHKGKVFYSWFDAPIGYIGITQESGKDWKEWWTGKDVSLVQFMGKDNIPFHTILFPSFLIGTGDKYNLVEKLSVNEYLNFEGGMFSKSRNIGVFGDDAMKSGVRADVWRYYILVNRPEKTDTDFTWDDFQSKNNSELLANLGNLVNRVLTFCKNNFENVPKVENDDFLVSLIDDYSEISCLMDKIEIKEALRKIMLVSKKANQFFQENEPWKVIKEDKDTAANVIAVLLQVVKDLAILVEPFMPGVSADIKEMICLEDLDWKDLGLVKVKKLGTPKILFNKIEDEDLAEFKSKFGEKKEFPLKLLVGEVVSVSDHPEADKLYVLKVNVGKEKTIVAGIKQWYSPEDLVGKKVIVVSNLKPAKLRGVMSEGMMLAAEKSGEVELLSSSLDVGSLVFPEGYTVNKKEIDINKFAESKLKIKDKTFLWNDILVPNVSTSKVLNGKVR